MGYFIFSVYLIVMQWKILCIFAKASGKTSPTLLRFPNAYGSLACTTKSVRVQLVFVFVFFTLLFQWEFFAIGKHSYKKTFFCKNVALTNACVTLFSSFVINIMDHNSKTRAITPQILGQKTEGRKMVLSAPENVGSNLHSHYTFN